VFEGLFLMITVLAEAIIAVISVLVEFTASFFVAAGEMLSIIDLGLYLSFFSCFMACRVSYFLV